MRQKLFILFIISVFFVAPRAFAATPIKILIVPGHDNEVWGAQYGNIKEADMTLQLGTQLFNILKQDKRFEVHITRDSLGYTTEFADYFLTHHDDILAFRKNAKAEMQANIISGSFIPVKSSVTHNVAKESVAQILYGINKWADDNKMDMVIHIHFNDYPRKTPWTMGEYKGFVIYEPESQMPNSVESIALAQSIFTQLRKKYYPSTYPKELGGLVPEQSLIALGARDTLISSVRSILIEYGYIYRFGNSTKRHQAYKDMASLTTAGIKNYFFPK